MSWPENLRRYRSSRFPLPVFGPLAGGLVAASYVGGSSLEIRSGLVRLLVVLLWLLQFRVLDDLFDRELDRRKHPGRILVRARVEPFRAFLGGLIPINVALAAALLGATAALGFLGLTVVAFGGYFLSRRWRIFRLLHVHAVLLKYPAFVFLLAPGWPLTLSRAATLGWVFLALALYELLHDHSLRDRPGGRLLLSLEGLVFILVSLLPWLARPEVRLE